MLCYHSCVGIVTGQYPLEESGGNVGGPLSQMSEAVNKIDNGVNQANAGNGMGSSGNGLSASSEIFHNNKVRSLKVIILHLYCLQQNLLQLGIYYTENIAFQLGPQTPYTPGMPATPHTPGSSSTAGAVSKMACSPSQYPNNNMSTGLQSTNSSQQQQVRFGNLVSSFYSRVDVKRFFIILYFYSFIFLC